MKESQPLSEDDQGPPVDPNEAWAQGKIERHLDNLAHLDGRWHGTLYIHGVGQPKGKHHGEPGHSELEAS